MIAWRTLPKEMPALLAIGRLACTGTMQCQGRKGVVDSGRSALRRGRVRLRMKGRSLPACSIQLASGSRRTACTCTHRPTDDNPSPLRALIQIQTFTNEARRDADLIQHCQLRSQDVVWSKMRRMAPFSHGGNLSQIVPLEQGQVRVMVS